MAIHSSILAWRVPWTEEPGVLSSVTGSQNIWLGSFLQKGVGKEASAAGVGRSRPSLEL